MPIPKSELARRVRPVRLPKYLSLALTAVQRAVAYRKSTLLNLAANAVWVTALYHFWRAVFESNPSIEGFDWPLMQTYVLFSYAVNGLFSLQFELLMFRAIRNGEIEMDLIRPYDYQMSQLARATGAALVDGVMVGGMVLLIGGVFVGLVWPSLGVGVLGLMSVGLGFLIKFLISYITGLLCFWTLNSMGLVRTRIAVTNIFSGALIPLDFFPAWLQTMANLSPFPAAVYTPVSILLGNVAGAQLVWALAIQVLWVVLLWWGARLLWIPASRVLVVQGG